MQTERRLEGASRAFRVEGACALVTGAASGIGRAIATELHRRGASLDLVDIDAEGLGAVADQLASNAGARPRCHVVDLGDEAALDHLTTALVAAGGVDLLVNNAGVAVVGPYSRISSADWSRIQKINVDAPLRLTRALLPGMLARGSGHVVIVASCAGLVGAPGMVAYSTTKFALVGFAESLRHELEGAGVGVTAICPGYVRTNLHRSTRYDNPGFQRFLDAPPSFYGLWPDDVARAAVDAIVKRRPLVVRGPEKLGWWLKRLSPELAHRAASWVAKRTGIAI